MTARNPTLKLMPILAAMALIGCGEREPTDQPAGDGSAEDAAPPPQSIIRPDVEPRAATQQLLPLKTRIAFAQGGSDLSEIALAELATVRQSPQLAEGGPIVLRGHSDAGGSDAANMRASTARAQAVADWLVEMGVSQERIVVIGFGEQNPVEPNALPDGSENVPGREANRRVDITVELPAGNETPAPSESTPEESTPEES
ncbi:MAG: OmpA family protein [Erythrobacter sp.]